MCSAAAIQTSAFLPLMFVQDLPGAARTAVLLLGVCLYFAAGLVIGPSWNSLMGDLVPEASRGAYFGRRSRHVQVSSFASIVAAGLLLGWFKENGREGSGFTLIFSIASSCRLISLWLLSLHWDPPMQSPPGRRTFSMVAETMRDRGHRVLVLYLSLMSFALNLSAPYFSAYLLRPAAEHGLAWSYPAFTAVNAITAFFKFLFLPVWGRTADRFGSRKCLVLASWLLSTLPLFWLLPGAVRLGPAAICLGQAWAGFVMAGHELSSFNFLLDSSQPAVRPRLVASMNMINALMAFLGSAAGGAAVSLAPGWTNPFLVVFVLSILARFLVCAALARRLREVRVVERIGYRSLFFRLSVARAQFGPLLRFFLVPKEKVAARQAGA